MAGSGPGHDDEKGPDVSRVPCFNDTGYQENHAMMFRESPAGPIAISQPSHAWLSGQIIRAWGNSAFSAVAPYEDVCLGAEQHDIGWLTWEHSPTFNPATGRPHSFRELSVSDHTAIWRRGTEMALAFGRYPALLVSLHGTGLYASFDAASASAADAVIVADFLRGQREIQQRLLESLGADQRLSQSSNPGTVERNRRLVRTADRMSIAICTGMADMAVSSDDPRQAVVSQVPTADGETDIRMRATSGDLTKIAVTPWPFDASAVQVSCEGILLPAQQFDDADEMRAALRSAAKTVLTAELSPG
jgi:hypothetical protein